MKSKKAIIFPKHKEILEILGENIKLARLRRKLTTTQVSERAAVSRSTLFLIEKGTPSVSMGHYFCVLRVLNLHLDFLSIASDDVFGRKLQDLELLNNEVNKKEEKITYTYLMVNSSGHTKIGKSINPKNRERTLQSQEPCVKLYATVDVNIELILHEKYKDKRIRGEWFDLSQEDLDYILQEFNFETINL